MRIASIVTGCLFGAVLLIGSGESVSAFDGRWFDTRFEKSWDLTESTAEILVRYEPAATSLDRELLAIQFGLTSSHPFDALRSTEVYRVASGDRPSDLSSELRALDLVRDAVPAVVDQEGFTKYYLPGEVTVQFRNGITEAQALARIAAAGSSVIHDHWTPGYYTIAVPNEQTVFEAIRSWYQDDAILFSEPSYMLYDDELHEPNDPLFFQQWNLANTGQYNGTPGADVEATLAWDVTKGDPDVIVCVIDTGMDLTHEDLAANLLPRNGEDWAFDNGDTSPDDTGNHGTACSGIAVAVQDNGIGVSGVAPHCRIMPLRVSLVSGQNQSRADAINYAASRRAEFTGLVMSCSWRMSSGDFTAVQNAIINADALDCIIVFASGNGNGSVDYPARYPETIACGASSPCDERKSYSSCDGENFWGSNYGPELDVIAPGVLITTTDRTGGAGYAGGNYYQWFNGTSSATPLAAGVCALIWSINPTLSADGVRAILEASAEDQVGPSNEDTPGWDPYFGHGRINAYQAVMMAGVVEEFEDDMENGEGSWGHYAVGVGEDGWHLSQQRNHTDGGTTSYKCGDPQGGSYGTSVHAALESPLILLGDDARLIFWHWMDAYAVNDSSAGDGGVLEVTTDGGASWANIDPLIGGYDHVWRQLGGPFLLFTPLWSGSFDWTQVLAPLAEYSGQTIRFRYRFGARGAVPTGEGWYVDDVLIHVPGPAGLEEVIHPFSDLRLEPNHPNPFPGATSIRYRLGRAASVRIDVIDLAGRVVFSLDRGVEEAGPHTLVWEGADSNGRPAANGIYFARVTAGRLSETERMVLLR